MGHRNADTDRIMLSTAVPFILLEALSLVAVSAGLSAIQQQIPPQPQPMSSRGGWFFVSLLLFLLCCLEWIGYGISHLLLPRHHGMTETMQWVHWQGERFLAVAFWTSLAMAVAFGLALANVIALQHAIIVAGSFAALLPVCWFASVVPFSTRPPASFVRKFAIQHSN